MIENREDFNLLQNVGGNRVKICTKKVFTIAWKIMKITSWSWINAWSKSLLKGVTGYVR